MIFQIIEAKGDRHKLTISPSEQRVTIKMAKDADDAECWRVEQFFRAIYNWTGFNWASTMRGRMEVGSRSITLWNDSRSFSREFESNGVNIWVKRISHE